MIKQNKAMTITGWILAIIPALLLILSATMKFANPDAKAQMMQAGFTETRILVIGLLELGCLIIYLIPPTAVLGAVLLTGYLGGAVATHVRGGDPVLNCVLPAILGALIWLSLFLRDGRIRALLPCRCCAKPKSDAPVA